MSRYLLLVCNSRSATLSLHELDLDTHRVALQRDIALPVPVGENSASSMLLGADGAQVYLAWRGMEKKLMRFALGRQSHDVALLDTLPLDDDICFLGLDHTGRRILGAGGESGFVLPLDAEGKPSLPIQRVSVGPLAHCIVDGGHGHVLAVSCRGDLLRRFDYDEKTGRLSNPLDLAQPKGSGPRHICVSADGRHAYLLTQEGGEVVVFSLARVPHEVQRLKLVDDQGKEFRPMGSEIALTPDGRFLYAAERNANRLVGFAVAGNGWLTRLGWVTTPGYPRAFHIDASGKFLTVLGFRGHGAAVFAVDGGSGSLSPIALFETGERPSWVLSVSCS